MRIRKATFKDIETISNIVCACYENFGLSDRYSNDVIVEPKLTRGSAKCIQSHIETENVFVADDENCVRGMISIQDNEIVH